VAVSNIEKASVADATTFRLPGSNKLPVGWEMGKTPDGVEALFVNTGRCNGSAAKRFRRLHAVGLI
jgi:hypothetical protein